MSGLVTEAQEFAIGKLVTRHLGSHIVQTGTMRDDVWPDRVIVYLYFQEGPNYAVVGYQVLASGQVRAMPNE